MKTLSYLAFLALSFSSAGSVASGQTLATVNGSSWTVVQYDT